MEDSFFDSVSRAQWYGDNTAKMLSSIPTHVPSWYPKSDTLEQHQYFHIQQNVIPSARRAWHLAEHATALYNLYF